MSILSVKNLYIDVNGKEIVKAVNLEMACGEVHVLMGPTTSGKSTLAYAIMGFPEYEVTVERYCLKERT